MGAKTKTCFLCTDEYHVFWPGDGPEPEGYDDGLCAWHAVDFYFDDAND
jgi:hypothetical protein